MGIWFCFVFYLIFFSILKHIIKWVSGTPSCPLQCSAQWVAWTYQSWLNENGLLCFVFTIFTPTFALKFFFLLLIFSHSISVWHTVIIVKNDIFCSYSVNLLRKQKACIFWICKLGELYVSAFGVFYEWLLPVPGSLSLGASPESCFVCVASPPWPCETTVQFLPLSPFNGTERSQSSWKLSKLENYELRF